ncbi:hypothetical protein RvY_12150 [Ramazzottius varieornatus]|uniref:Receptor ligand binding region domain-containing protein n=1 Tax=Ramazzottius varieornatus TaxID=947166 RepID=A0A1D1VIH2_RAMVA|nr:hypothetical protein RvY_12150 [Ramazzottius varieornatus]
MGSSRQNWKWIIPLMAFVSIKAVSLRPRLNVTVTVFGLSKPYVLSALPYTLPGYLAGLDSISSQYFFSTTTTILTDAKSNNSRNCDELEQYLDLVPQYYYSRPKDGSVFLLLHSGCSEIYELSAMSSGMVTPNPLQSLDVFRNQISSTVIDFPQIHGMLRQVLKYFSWTTIAIVRDDDSMFRTLAEVLGSLNENIHDKLAITTFLLPRNFTDRGQDLLPQVKASARKKTQWVGWDRDENVFGPNFASRSRDHLLPVFLMAEIDKSPTAQSQQQIYIQVIKKGSPDESADYSTQLRKRYAGSAHGLTS